ncbi:hypothetical protein [Streptomyces swartbergensis]
MTAAVPRAIWLTRSALSAHASAIRLKEIQLGMLPSSVGELVAV